MKHLKLFFALFAMLALGVGNAWGAEVTLTGDYTNGGPTGWSQTGSKKTGYWQLGTDGNYIQSPKFSSAAGGVVTVVIEAYVTGSSKSSDCQLIGLNSEGNTVETQTVTCSSTNMTSTYPTTSWVLNNAENNIQQIKFIYKKAASSNMRVKNVKITYNSGSTEPALSATPTEIDFGTIYQGATVADKTVAVNFANLTGNVTYSGLSTPFTATGAISATGDKITISADASTIGEHSQTLTIQSAADSKTAEVTVKMNVEAPFNGKKLGFDFVNHPTGWPVKNSATAGEYVYNLDDTDYTFKHSKSGDGVYVAGTSGTSGYLLIASGNTLGLPAIKGHKLVKVQGTLNNSGNPSTSASVSITDGTNTLSGGTALTWNTKGGIYTYSLSGTQANTMYYLSVSNKNLQMITLVLYYEECEKYALTITEPAVGTGTLLVKDGENTLTSGAEIYEGTKLTVTATPETGYEEGVIVVMNASDDDITATVYADGVLTMPAYAVTISATFEKKECTLLDKPTVSATTTYNSATLTWEAVANAAKYSVKVGTADAVETTAISYEVTDLNAATEYTYQVQAIAESDQDISCDSEVAEGTFTTATAPVATVTLSDVDGEQTLTGSLYGTITLPKTAAECSKTFVGWSEVEILEPSEKPATNFYAPGAEYTFTTLEPILYAVYADENNAAKEEVYTFTEFTQANTVTIDAPESFTIQLLKGSASTAPQWNAGSSQARIYAKGSLVISAETPISKIVYTYTVNKNNNNVVPNIDGVTGETNAGTWDSSEKTWTGNDTEVTFSTSGTAGNVGFTKVAVTVGAITYSNYSTTCAAAPTAEVDPTSVTATATETTGKLTVTYDNVNTEDVTVALYNDAACTEAFTAGWLTASIDDADKNITYTVAENTTYAERKAYIKLTAPETTGATDPAVVVIPVNQAAKDKVFASLEELVAADLTAGDEVTVTLNNDVIKEFYIYSSKRCGVVFDVQKDGKDIKIYFNSQTTIDDWAVSGKLSGTLTNVKWTTYSGAWQLAPANTWAWANLTYTEPKAVSTVVVSGAPTKTTYVDGEAFDPAGLTVTVNYNDATSEVNPTGVTFAVTPATLVKGQTSVSVTATFNSVTSAAYEVTGLTVNDLPTKTVAEFIAAGGTRCYLEGIVSDIDNTTYGNFNLTDASGTIYVYGCLNAAGESKKFAELDVKNGDKIKVIADQFKVYGGKDQATDVQYVSHISAATITIADITMEVGETKTIAATITPAAAETAVVYTIKENTDNAISLSGNTITADAVGTATITATIATAAEYMGKTVDFTVTINAKSTKEKVVILAEYEGQWYAMKAQYVTGKTSHLAPLPVTYFDGKLYNVSEEDKALIEWERTIVDGKATFFNNNKYLTGKSDKTDLTLAATSCNWTISDDSYLIGARTFLYNAENNWFRNFGTSNAGDKNYSGMPVVTAPVYTTGDVTYTRATTAGKFGTICLPFGSTNYTGAEFFEFVGSETGKVYIGSVDELVAGVPYIFLASAAKVVVTSDGTTAATPGNSNGLYGTFTNDTEVAIGNYILKDNALCLAEAICWVNAYRAYIVMSEVPTEPVQQMPGRRYIGMNVQGENGETGFENITAPAGKTVKAIVNGQLIIIRDGEMYNAQGQRL